MGRGAGPGQLHAAHVWALESAHLPAFWGPPSPSGALLSPRGLPLWFSHVVSPAADPESTVSSGLEATGSQTAQTPVEDSAQV